jgi:para-aminobenzoate synthetase component 1
VFEPPGCTAHALIEIDDPRDPLDAFERLRRDHCPWLLDSALQSPRLGRYSFVGADPYLVLRARGPRIELDCRRAVHPGLVPGRHVIEGPVLPTLRRLIPAAPASGASLPFVGGAVGYLGYELAEQLDVHRLHGRDDLGLADVVLLFVDALVGFDHVAGTRCISALGQDVTPALARCRAEAAAEALARRLAAAPTARASRAGDAGDPAIACDLDPAAYAKAVDSVKQEIAAGNVYQACLTGRVDRPFDADPWTLYRALRRTNPAPFASYLELPEVAIVGSSPERFLLVSAEGRVESRPIKGTAPRGRDPAEDAALRRALESSEKDRAENLMIVDLVRNDLGRVCRVGSVRVPELMAIETYASVFQMVSTVSGRLREGCDALDCVAATFPPGSMTGAPKIAAMRILDRFESVRRGVYSGAIGYLDARGGADLSVAIRTILVQGGRARLHGGGGIVADSVGAEEVREVGAKLAPLLAALAECRHG